jgi:hypothetical protein
MFGYAALDHSEGRPKKKSPIKIQKDEFAINSFLIVYEFILGE